LLHPISALDWIIIGGYLAGLIAFGAYLSRRQFRREDYYIAGHDAGPWPIAISTMATQCSTNSILGAPAFVAFSAGGGLLWLQYELAVPLAMIAVMIFLLPMFRQLRLVSVYEYLERRFGIVTRLTLSALFQLVRAFATSVTVYSIAIVIELITGLSFLWAVVLLGAITVIYDVLGGVRAVIYSDVLQMGVLVTVLLFLFALLMSQLGGVADMLAQFPESRRQALDFQHHGLGDGHDYSFWPMLFGGFFLYVSYYGCDQSQMQRELCVRNVDDGNHSLFVNGLIRFPLVLLYCMVGVGIAVYAAREPAFIGSLSVSDASPNYNLAVPAFILQQLPVGLVGFAMVALFAAAMSSLDSVINSLSATTMEDFVLRFKKHRWNDKKELLVSRFITILWGLLTLWFSFYVGDIAETVIEAINKIGSLINGPVLGVFTLGILTRRANGRGALVGLLSGFLLNLYCWQFIPGISWLWWNVFGFFAAVTSGYLASLVRPVFTRNNTELTWSPARYRCFGFKVNWVPRYWALFIWFAGLVVFLLWLQG
jgi:SSS family solute:Na+ symporter